MLAQHVLRKKPGERRDRRENVSQRPLRALRFFLFVICSPSRRPGAADVQQRRRPDRLVPLRAVSPARGDRSIQPDHLRRCAAARGADCERDRAADHAAVEAGGRAKASSRTNAASPTANFDAAAMDRRRRAGRRSLPRSAHAAGVRGRLAARHARIWSFACQRTYAVPADGADVFRTFVLPIPVDRRALRARDGISSRQRARRAPREPRRRSHAIVPPARRARSGTRLRQAAWSATPATPKGSCSAGRRGRRRIPRPTARSGASSRAAISSSSCTCSRPASSNASRVSVGFFFTDTPPARTPVGLRLGSETIDIPPGDRAATSSRDRYQLPVDAELLAVQPHAHNLARRMEARRGCPTAPTRPLIAIDDWDFRWQDVYRYATPFALPKGTTMSMRYTYDNSADNPRNPHRPPARVVWGQNTSDEMGDLWLQVIPRARGRRADPDRGLPPQGARRGSRGLHQAAARRSGQPAAARRGRRRCISTPGSSTRRSPSSASRCG